MAAYRFLLLLTVLIVGVLSAHGQILGRGECRLTVIPVKAGGQVCERVCYHRGYRGPPIICRPVTQGGMARVCGGGCCRTGFNCLQLLYA
ncbi:hypothetical protein KR067_000270 [Drosophila pandora]|nr:hypothetical protein KR067_000270 [Drosophila pandora]